MIKKELLRTLLLLINRIVRGFIIPNMFNPLIYDSIVQVFALSRFSTLFDFGYRELAINTNLSKFYIKKVVVTSILSGLAIGIFSVVMMDTLYLSLLLVPILFLVYNVRYVYSIILVRIKNWSVLLFLELIGLVFLISMILSIRFLSRYNLEVLFFFETLFGIFLSIYFYTKVKITPSPLKIKNKSTTYFNSIQEFCIGNIESVVLVLPFILNRGLLSIYIGITAIGLIFADPFCNFVIEKKIKRPYIYCVFLVLSILIFFLQMIVLHENSFFQIVGWSYWNMNFALYSIFLLNCKFVYNYERKLYLVKSLNNPLNKIIQNITLTILLIVTCIFLFYSYNN